VKIVRLSLLLSALVVLNFAHDANAGGYGSLGSAWTVNTYHHDMSFIAPSSDVKNQQVLFISDTTWYDNIAVCQNNGGSTTLSPGIGQSDPFRILNPDALQALVTPDDCDKKSGACTDSVTYVNKVSDLEDPARFAFFQCAGDSTNFFDRLACFYQILNLTPQEQAACQNKNGTLVEVRTKGVCAITTARKCDSKGCTDEAAQGYRFTYPSFTQPAGAVFTATKDDNCTACVNGETEKCFTPAPLP